MTPQQNQRLAEFAGWEYIPSHDAFGHGGPDWYKDGETIWDATGLPDYSIPENLWLVERDLVGKMNGLGYLLRIVQMSGEEFAASCVNHKTQSSFDAIAPTISLAICNAVLKYLDAKEGK